MYIPHREEFVYSNKRWDSVIYQQNFLMLWYIPCRITEKEKGRENANLYSPNNCWFEKAVFAQKTEENVSTQDS